jgi:hypothetical protein
MRSGDLSDIVVPGIPSISCAMALHLLPGAPVKNTFLGKTLIYIYISQHK